MAKYVPGDPRFQMLARSDWGDEVLALQEALNAAGYDLKLDARFGRKTEEALHDFQSRQGLKIDGLAGPITLAALPRPEKAKPRKKGA